jgi:hypothetical protein
MVFLAIVGAIGATLVAIGGRHYWKQQARRARELTYESALRAYSQDLKPGLTRKDVEAYLPARSIRFDKTCSVGQHDQVDLVKIGEEDTPWYCGAEYVYLAFEFAAVKPPRQNMVLYLV